MPLRSYATPEGFRQALETRVRAAAGSGGMGRFRQVLIYDRFLARVFQHLGDRAVAKGGVVLELRLERARTTRDVDILLRGPSDGLLTELRTAGRLDLGDFLAFEIEPDREHPGRWFESSRACWNQLAICGDSHCASVWSIRRTPRAKRRRRHSHGGRGRRAMVMVVRQHGGAESHVDDQRQDPEKPVRMTVGHGHH